VTIEEWRGTCSAKHYLLAALFEELGIPSTLIVAPHEFTAASSPWLPPHLLAMLDEGPIPDVHNFLRVQPAPDGDWMTVDATWPIAARELGMPANEAYAPGVEMRVACDPDEVYHVPPDVNPHDYKQRVLAEHCAGHEERRERFIAGLGDWLASTLG
jgi:hypothetical protein